MKATVSGVLGIFSHMDVLIEAITKFRGEGRTDITVYTPTPRHELAHAMEEKVSPVRLWTLIGGLTGCTTGYLFTSFVSLDWILPTSGKAVVSLQAYTVIAFELTILFGSIFTIMGIINHARMFRKRTLPYDDRFTEDKFGIFVPCGEGDYDSVSSTMRDRGAEEVSCG
ncbi:MAG: DUF3341 domain-containing protein [Acidobacteria bacterium]|nr:DUF3341 domain-containing protein [Acidobacteriota bacterium]